MYIRARGGEIIVVGGNVGGALSLVGVAGLGGAGVASGVVIVVVWVVSWKF